MLSKIPKENSFRAPTVEDARKPPVMLKYTGDKSWSAFMRGATCWSIYEEDGIFQIDPIACIRRAIGSRIAITS